MGGCAPWSSHANTSTSRWASGRCGPSSPRRPRATRTRASSSTPTSSSSPSPSLRWAVRLAGYGFVVAVPEIYHRHRAAGHRARVRRRGQGARPGRRRAPRRSPSSTRTSRPRSRGWANAARGRRRRPLHGRAPGVPRGVPAARARAPRAGTRPGCTTASSARSRRGLARARGRDLRRAAADLRHARPAHAAPGARRSCAEASTGDARFSWHEYDAEHAFGRDVGPRFDPEATDAAFAETVAFFRRVAVILYDHPASANCLKARVLLRQLGLPFETVHVDLFSGETRQPEHLARNPDGRVPVLETRLRRPDPGVGRDPAVPRRGHAVPAADRLAARARATSGCSSSRTRSRRGSRSRASWR